MTRASSPSFVASKNKVNIWKHRVAKHWLSVPWCPGASRMACEQGLSTSLPLTHKKWCCFYGIQGKIILLCLLGEEGWTWLIASVLIHYTGHNTRRRVMATQEHPPQMRSPHLDARFQLLPEVPKQRMWFIQHRVNCPRWQGGQGEVPFWFATCNSEQLGFLQGTRMGLAGHRIPWMPLCSRRDCVYTLLVKQDCWGLESFQFARKLGIRSFCKQGELVTINNSSKGLATEELKEGNGRLGIWGLCVRDFNQPEKLLRPDSSHPDTLQECHCNGLCCSLP